MLATFFNGIINILPHRVSTAKVIYQFMIISTFFTVISVPYEAIITSNENMLFYAIEGIIEAVLKLIIAMYLVHSEFDHLLTYGFLMTLLSIALLLLRRIYCHWKYNYCKISIVKYYDKNLLSEMSSFAGWSLLGTSTAMISNYGQGIVTNNFFGTRINAAQGVADQVSGQLSAFTLNMLKALNPVIVKSEGENNRDKMLKLTFLGSKISFMILAIFALPFILEIKFVFSFWLTKVPQYAIIFTVLLLVRRLIEQLFVTLSVSLSAVGKIKGIQIAGSILNIFPLLVGYILFSLGYPPFWIYIVFICVIIIRTFGITLHYADKHCNINKWIFIKTIAFPCVFVSLFSVLIGYLPIYFMGSTFLRLVIVFVSFSTCFIILSYYAIFNQSEREMIIKMFHKLKVKFLS